MTLAAIDYETMPAGAELDMLIIEHVLGWERRDIAGRPPEGMWAYVDRDGKPHVFDAGFIPSLCLEHAWYVVEKLKDIFCWNCNGEGTGFQLHYTPEQLRSSQYEAWGYNMWHEQAWYVVLEDHADSVCGVGADTAPLAICRAALAVIRRE